MRTPLLLILPLAAGLALSGCGAETSESSLATPSAAVADGPARAAGNGATDSAAGDDAASPGAYVDYATYQADPSAYTGSDVVLFFHATWCSSCKATEASLTGDGVPDGLTVVKVDYDTQTDLRKKYKITQQHTFVAVDAAGNELGTWAGSLTGEEIKAKAGATA